MNRVAKLVVERNKLAGVLILVIALVVSVLSGVVQRNQLEQERMSRLQLDTESRGVKLSLQTLKGNQMGAIGLLGIIDESAKQEALNQLAPNNDDAKALMVNVARLYDADGTFLVGQDGIVKSSWGVGKPLTGVNVGFRPYFQTALKGKENVYAAIGTTTGRRNLYFAAPMYSGHSTDTPVIGAVVMRTGIVLLDKLVADAGQIALLLSPQGLVFSASKEEWIGRISGTATPERVQEIRKLKQFGVMFDTAIPQPLPFSVEPGIARIGGRRHAVIQAKVNWNDPYGDWTLVVVEDLSRTVSFIDVLLTGIIAGGLALLFALMTLHLLRGHHAQTIINQKLKASTREQQAHAARKTRLAAATMRMQRAKNRQGLVSAFLDEAHDILSALQGVVYVADNNAEHLHLAGSYACAEHPPETIAFGEGLLGQCAVERRSQMLAVKADRFIMVRSGLGDSHPEVILFMPIVLNDILLGVAEIALLHKPDDAERQMFDELVSLLAMNLEIVERSSPMENVLQ
jgi:two-component system C4-dicarboxylate transport sensor histidine kinase DctB